MPELPTLRPGEDPTAAHLNQLGKVVNRKMGLTSEYVWRTIFPWGTHSRPRPQPARGLSAPVFEPFVINTEDGAEVGWTGPRALIGGVAPTIEGKEIFSEDEATGERPRVRVARKSFGANGECSVFFRVECDPDFRARTITPVALPALPAPAPKVAYLLALFLRQSGEVITYDEDRDRQLFCAQGFMACNKRANGIFTPLFWAKF